MKAKKSLEEIAQEITLLSNYEDYEPKQIIDLLKFADEVYYNTKEGMGGQIFEDKDYDMLRKYASAIDPFNPYFNEVGKKARGSKVRLPYPMGSLDQVEVGQISHWLRKWELDDNLFVITDKLDGISALLIYDDHGRFQIGYSRGDGFEGQDISRHLRLIPSVKEHAGPGMAIRGEIIIRRSNWETVNRLVKTKAGRPYKNMRNCIAGLMNAESNAPEVYNYIDFVAYSLMDGVDSGNMSKNGHLTMLASLKFLIPHKLFKGSQTMDDDTLSSYLGERKDKSPYEIDGLVIDVNGADERRRMNPTRDTLNPAYSVKYKITSLENIKDAKVLALELNISKHGYIKPKIAIEPTDIEGVTITHCKGFNMKFIKDNKLGPGAVIKVTRAGSVIPFCLDVVAPMLSNDYDGWLNTQITKRAGEWQWNDTHVDAVVLSPEENREVAIRQTINFFSAIDVPGLKEGTIRKMFELEDYLNGTRAIHAMLHYDFTYWKDSIGANGEKIYEGIRDRMHNIPLYVILGISPCFGRGVGVRKFRKLLSEISLDSISALRTLTFDQIVAVEGFEAVTAAKILDGIEPFLDFIHKRSYCEIDLSLGADGDLAGQKFCFTGFRSKEMQRLIEEAGGEVSSGVSRKTTYVVAKNAKSNSGKVKKARDLGITIIGIPELEEMVQ
jgi:DNA ligase (NAD+)